MRIIKTGIFYLLGVFGIICISVFPQYFATYGISNPLEYFKDLGAFFLSLTQSDSWMYQSPRSPGDFSLIGTLWDPYIYSMQIFLGAILLGSFFAFVLALSANFLPQPLLTGLKRLLNIFESIPDVVIAVSLQAFTIYIYHAFGLSLFAVAGYGENKVFFAPIVTLSILPMISLFKILLLRIEEEVLKDYVYFLKSKGIHKTVILVRHILRNIIPMTFQHSKVIIWAALSSQFIIEYLFNVNGLSFYIIDSFNPMTIAVSLLLIFTPFFIFFQVIDLWLFEAPLYSQDLIGRKSYSFQPFQSFREFIGRIRHFQWAKIKPWKPVTYTCGVLLKHLKNRNFMLGIMFFIITIGISFTYSIATNNQVDQATIIYEEDGITVKSVPPHSPGQPFLLGSDNYGYDLLDQIIVGAKYTLIFGLLIALLRVFIGLFGGVLFAFSLKEKMQNWIEKLVDSIHFLPLTVIAYILLQPILTVGINMVGAYTMSERIILEIIILTFLAIPLTTVLIGNDIKHVLQNEFVMSARVLGGSKFHILFRHVLPHISTRLAILIGQQFIQILFVFIHLGVLQLFFGGSIDEPDDYADRSITYEWSGLISLARREIWSGETHFWLIFWPLLAFMLSIYAMQMVITGVKEIQQNKIGVLYKFRKIKRNIKTDTYVPDFKPHTKSFERMEQKEKFNR